MAGGLDECDLWFGWRVGTEDIRWLMSKVQVSFWFVGYVRLAILFLLCVCFVLLCFVL